MSRRPALAAIAAAVALALPPAASAEELKVGYLDYQRILLEVNDGKAARARLQKWLEEKQKEIESDQAALRKEKETIDKQEALLSEEARLQKHTALQQKVYELAQRWEAYRAEAARREQQEMEPIVAKIDSVVAQIAEREGFDYVLEKQESGVIFAKQKHDLSNDVIRTYNGAKGSSPKKK